MAKYISIYFDLFQEKLDDHQPNRKQKYFRGGLIFQGLRLSLRHFGQQAPESPVSAPKWSNIFSTSFHCGLIDNQSLPKVQILQTSIPESFFFSYCCSRKPFLETVDPENFLCKLSFQKTFFANCRFTHNPSP